MPMTDDRPVYYKNCLIQIFRDHWEQFKQFHPGLVDENTETNVQKMMSCGSFENGYAEYRCSCGHVKRVPFSCKSRFCLRCSKVYTDNWLMETLSSYPQDCLIPRSPDQLTRIPSLGPKNTLG